MPGGLKDVYMGLPYYILNFSVLTAWYNFILCAVPGCELCFNDFSSFDLCFLIKLYLYIVIYLFFNLLYIFTCKYENFYVCVKEMKTNNLLVMSKFSYVAVKKLYFKRSSTIYVEIVVLFSHRQTLTIHNLGVSFVWGFFGMGVFVWGVMS